jgi:hypothetical protein
MVMLVLVPPELELEDDELLELEELLDEELELEELEELDDDELELLLELEELELEEELDELLPELEPLGIEHSLIPPATRVPGPKVTSPQVKLPFSVMKVN